jgi:tRNA(Leu) C34 or U34 (ribose-2'-O)-methylase TrmL
MAKRELGEMKITQKNTKQRSIEKWEEMGLKRWRVWKKIVRQAMKKAFVFILEVQVHNERKAVKTENELLSFILEVYKG